MKVIVLLLAAAVILPPHVLSQANDKQPNVEGACAAPIYEKKKEVAKPAVITSKPFPAYPEKSYREGVSGSVLVSAVLCRSGEVTDIKVKRGLPHGVTEAVLESVRRIKFKPAEKDGQPVSYRVKLEYSFRR